MGSFHRSRAELAGKQELGGEGEAFGEIGEERSSDGDGGGGRGQATAVRGAGRRSARLRPAAGGEEACCGLRLQPRPQPRRAPALLALHRLPGRAPRPGYCGGQPHGASAFSLVADYKGSAKFSVLPITKNWDDSCGHADSLSARIGRFLSDASGMHPPASSSMSRC